MSDPRTVLVPDGLEGERVDSAIARLFGLSRTRAADLAAGGGVSVNATHVGKSHRVSAGDMLEVQLPASPSGPTLEVVAEPVPGMTVVHADEDIVVVDKPVGVAAHPSVGWTGPNVLAGLKAAGYRISTSGASERQGIVSRLDVGTSGLMVVATSERGYSVLKRAFKERRVDKTYHTLVQGLPDPLVGTIDAPIGRHPGHDYKFAVMDSGKHAVTHYELHRGLPPRIAARDPSRDRPYPPDQGAHGRGAPPLRRRPHLRCRPDPVRPARARAPVAARRRARFRAPGLGRVGHLREPLPRGPAHRARPALTGVLPLATDRVGDTDPDTPSGVLGPT